MILVGTDLSEAAAHALEVARALAAQAGDREVILVHVVDPERPEAGGGDLDAARELLEALAHDPGPGPAIRTEIVVGEPDATLVGFADTERCDLIVIAAASRATEESDATRLGRTAAAVISKATVPVIAVRDPAPWLAFARGERPLRLLVGVDESATCDLGIQWVKALARRGKVSVVLGAIYYTDEAAEFYGLGGRHLVDRDPEIERLTERDLLRRFGAPAGVELTAKARRGLGRIGDHVCELARDEAVDAILVGTGQKTGLGKLGSVSGVVVADAAQSVVCVPPQADVTVQSVPLLRRALVATDLSPFANRAVPYAFALAGGNGEVHVVHVVKPDDAPEVDEPALVDQLYALAPAGSAAAKTLAHVVRGEDAALAIAQCAARLGVDVICIASHGRSGISRALVGSVADRLLRATRLPVLVLRPQDS
ncbi:MAG TPA: universal stress protein [Kofleriaceae bacterium]|jgi:nucleotide-binding universal stress UspA family protein